MSGSGRGRYLKLMAGLHGGLEIGQMIFERSNAGDQDAVALGKVNNPAFEGDDAHGVRDAHGS